MYIIVLKFSNDEICSIIQFRVLWEKIIYHYCNVESFKAIFKNKTIWFSSVL